MSNDVYNIGGPNPNFADLNAIDSTVLTQGNNTVQIYPGTYTAPVNMVATDISFKGMGDRDDVIILANSELGFSFANTSSGTITFENVHLKGQDTVATGEPAGANTCVTKLGAASTPMHFRNCKFSHAEHAVLHNGEGAFCTTTDQIDMRYCEADVDKALVSNANITAMYTSFGYAANAYHTATSGYSTLRVRTMLCGPNAAKAGTSTESILATIA